MQQQEEIIFALIIGTFLFLFLCVCLLLFFILFKNSKKRHIQEKKSLQLTYKNELANATIEIQESTLQHISRELHDNIGQLLTVAKIHMNSITKYPEKRTDEKLKETNSILEMAISELKTLSKTPITSGIKQFSLINTLSIEVERINKLESTHAILIIKGDIKPFNVDIKIIVYRIIQEFICNTIKHAAATKLNIVLNYNNDSFVLEIADNGKGFNMLDKLKCGAGVSNIKNRAALIGADCIFNSGEGGTRLKITINNYTQT